MVVYNGTPYSYVKNLQGDIVALLDSTGTVVVSYVYDAWGRPISKTGSLSSTLGTVQPFRYRGYVYDEETGLYYLRSRYYSADTCRFINGDGIISRNLYAYCNNSPVFIIDRSGFFPERSSQFSYTANSDDVDGDYFKYWEDRDIEYVSFGVGKGGQVKYVYNFDSFDEIESYANYLVNHSKYKNDFRGSAEGVAAEILFHAYGYLFFTALTEQTPWNFENKISSSEHADIGASIFDDNHPGLTPVLLAFYAFIYPEQFEIELETEYELRKKE